MYDATLDANHAFVREKTALGEIADFTGRADYDPENKPAIDAVFLRRLLLGLEGDGHVLMPGVRMRGARVEGRLDLADCSGSGGEGIPALALEACDLPDAIDLSGARVARLSIADSRFRELRGIGLKIDADFDFRRAVPLAVADVVTPPLYALDTAIPVLDLAQERECEPGRAPRANLGAGIPTPFGPFLEEVAAWRWAKTLYALIGAVVIGFAILVYSGVFKPKAQA